MFKFGRFWQVCCGPVWVRVVEELAGRGGQGEARRCGMQGQGGRVRALKYCVSEGRLGAEGGRWAGRRKWAQMGAGGRGGAQVGADRCR